MLNRLFHHDRLLDWSPHRCPEPLIAPQVDCYSTNCTRAQSCNFLTNLSMANCTNTFYFDTKICQSSNRQICFSGKDPSFIICPILQRRAKGSIRTAFANAPMISLLNLIKVPSAYIRLPIRNGCQVHTQQNHRPTIAGEPRNCNTNCYIQYKASQLEQFC